MDGLFVGVIDGVMVGLIVAGVYVIGLFPGIIVGVFDFNITFVNVPFPRLQDIHQTGTITSKYFD